MINEYKAHKFCCEDITTIENYTEAMADETQTWDCHHRLGVRDGKTVTLELKANNMYEHRPASELIFIMRSQHLKLHSDARTKGGKAMNEKLTFEQRIKRGKVAMAKMTFEQRAKGGKKNLGNHWFNNGIEQHFCKECPGEGWVRGRLRKKKEENEG